MNVTINVRRDLRTERHWESLNDDHPSEKTISIYLVEAKLTTEIEWKDLGSRAGARRKHSGKVPAEVFYLRIYEHKDDAENKACALGAKLESRGMGVELVFDQKIITRYDCFGRMENPVRLLAEVPRFLRKKILANTRHQDYF